MIRKLTALALIAAGISVVAQSPTPIAVAAAGRPNVVIIMSDDQRADKITPKYTPRIWDQLVDNPRTLAHPSATSTYFTNSFITNPVCCPSRVTVLTGQYSHTNGVWNNGKDYPNTGGFGAFNDEHTLAVDFHQQGYRTAMVGKYLNGYKGGHTTYVPPGWSKWFADNTGAYYDYGVTTNDRLLHFGSRPNDYSTRVLTSEALEFVNKPGPFFLYFSLNAPHGQAIPDDRDINRFQGEPDIHFKAQTSSMLEAAYGVDRAVGQLLAALPDNTIVLYMSDNGFMWNQPESDRGLMFGKIWPYNDSIRVPMILASLDGTINPVADVDDIVTNVDLRITLLDAAGLLPLSPQEGSDWLSDAYTPRNALLLEHYGDEGTTYCGIRTKEYMYARFHESDGSYTEELFSENPVDESTNLAQTNDAKRAELRALAEAKCSPAPPGYSWTP